MVRVGDKELELRGENLSPDELKRIVDQLAKP
jgi:hypothetical protein